MPDTTTPEGSIRRYATPEEIALEVHRANANGQHDEMPTRDDCPGCQGSPLEWAEGLEFGADPFPPAPAIQVRYCTPADCTNPHCSNYDANRADPPEVTHQLIPVPSEWRAFGDFYRQGYRLDREGMPPPPRPWRQAFQAGWIAGKGAKFAAANARWIAADAPRIPAHTFANGVHCYNPDPIVWANAEDCLHGND